MANPIHHPECEVSYHINKYNQDKTHEMSDFLALLGKCTNDPENFGIYEDEISEVHHGLDIKTVYRQVIWWEAINGKPAVR